MRHAMVCCCCCFFWLALPACAQEWKAGIAKANITPTQHMPMAGYGSRKDQHSDGKLTDLWVKVLVLEDARGHQAALLTFDLVAVNRDFSQSICAELKQRYQWDRSQIALCVSHTHTGPVVGKSLPPLHYLQFNEEDRKLVDDYEVALKSAVLSAVEHAVAELRPARLEYGSGTAGFAVNRRNNREPDVPQLREAGELKGPVDHDVPVLTVHQGEALAAIVFGYACHNTTLPVMQWSGDYAGYAQIDLEKKYPGSQAMFWSGCGADQNPLPRRTAELAQNYGQQLAQAVEAVVDGSLKKISPELKTAYEEIPLPLAPFSGPEQWTKDLTSQDSYVAARARMLLEQVEQGHPPAQTYPYPIETWTLGKQVDMVFLGGEVVVDYALRLKSELGMTEQPAAIWCAGYANDVMAYIPSRRVLQEGGYEGGSAMVYYGLPGPWAPELEEMIVSGVKNLLATQ